MASDNEKDFPGEWLVTKRLRVKREKSARASPLFIGLGFPRKLKKNEKNALFPDHNYGCYVQTGRAFTKHAVLERDALSALAHAMLAVELFLRVVSEENVISDKYGQPFDPEIDLVFLGTIGRRYQKTKGIKGKQGSV